MFERFTRAAREVVINAGSAARELRHDRIGTEHLLLALLRPDAGLPYEVLRGAGLDRETVRGTIVRHVGEGRGELGEADAAALREIGIDLDAVRDRVEETFGSGALRTPEPEPSRWHDLRDRVRGDHTPFSSGAKRVLELSLREARGLRHDHLGGEHILLGLLAERAGLAAGILAEAGLDVGELRLKVLEAVKAAA
jgi:ATP-dependent Clp protease ATP-binding subunit ClpA